MKIYANNIICLQATEIVENYEQNQNFTVNQVYKSYRNNKHNKHRINQTVNWVSGPRIIFSVRSESFLEQDYFAVTGSESSPHEVSRHCPFYDRCASMCTFSCYENSPALQMWHYSRRYFLPFFYSESVNEAQTCAKLLLFFPALSMYRTKLRNIRSNNRTTAVVCVFSVPFHWCSLKYTSSTSTKPVVISGPWLRPGPENGFLVPAVRVLAGSPVIWGEVHVFKNCHCFCVIVFHRSRTN